MKQIMTVSVIATFLAGTAHAALLPVTTDGAVEPPAANFLQVAQSWDGWTRWWTTDASSGDSHDDDEDDEDEDYDDD